MIAVLCVGIGICIGGIIIALGVKYGWIGDD